METKTYRLVAEAHDCFDGPGLRVEGISYSVESILPSISGIGLAHDIMEHTNGLDKIGLIHDELEAMGAFYWIRLFTGYINDKAASWRSAEDYLKAEFVQVYEDMDTYDFDFDIDWDSKPDVEDEEEFVESLINGLNAENVYEHSKMSWEDFCDGAIQHFKIGLERAMKMYPCAYDALAVFTAIERAYDEIAVLLDFEGQRFDLTIDYENARVSWKYTPDQFEEIEDEVA